MKNIFIAFVLATMGFGATAAFAQKETLAVSAIKPIPALVEATAGAGKNVALHRILQSLDGQLIDRLNATRKFEIVSRSDLKEVVKEQEFANSGNVDANDKSAAKQFKLSGAKYLLVTTVDNFQDFKEVAKFEGTGKSASKRVVQVSTTAKIWDSTTGKLLESANFQCSKKDITENASYSSKDADLSDELLVLITRELADNIANRLADVIYPAKVLVRRDKQITINRGDGTGVAPDQIWNVYAVGEELIDPDTKESLGREEVLVGKARISSVQPKTATAEILEDNGIEKGAVLRLPLKKTL